MKTRQEITCRKLQKYKFKIPAHTQQNQCKICQKDQIFDKNYNPKYIEG